MDTKSKEIFDALVAKEPHELNDEQVAFLRARRSYLNAELLAKFASILKGEAKAPASADGLEEKSVGELKELAEEKGIEVKGLKKAELIAAIREAGE